MCYYDNKQQLHKAAHFFCCDGFESGILKYSYRKPKNKNSVITAEQTEVGDQRNINVSKQLICSDHSLQERTHPWLISDQI